MALDVSSIQSNSTLPHDGQRHTAVHTALTSGAVAPADLNTAIRDLQRVSEAFNRRLSFSLNEKLGQVVVKVIDIDTDKVVREIPPKELQHVYERIRDVIGLLFDAQA
ncbi:MAG: flagellar protein FlaG [Spirochaetaceae bacterium]|nr:flagellar protein FlaG [Spirochaetaceae bacterium]